MRVATKLLLGSYLVTTTLDTIFIVHRGNIMAEKISSALVGLESESINFFTWFVYLWVCGKCSATKLMWW